MRDLDLGLEPDDGRERRAIISHKRRTISAEDAASNARIAARIEEIKKAAMEAAQHERIDQAG